MKAIVYHKGLKVATSVPVYFAPETEVMGELRHGHLWTTKEHIKDALKRLNEMTADEDEIGNKVYRLTGDSLDYGWCDCLADAVITIYDMDESGEPYRHNGLMVGCIGYSKWVGENC